MQTPLSLVVRWLFGPGPAPGEEGQRSTHLWARWIFLRALGLIFLSAFYSLYFQIHGLIGPDGILPAGDYLRAVSENMGAKGCWFAPTLLWFSSGSHALSLLCWGGLIASIFLTLNIWPRGSLAACLALFLSFIAAAQDFSSYQSDGMLLEAGFISLFFAPPGFLPGLGKNHPPSRASFFLLLWEWFRIYFESGMVKIVSGDPEWRHLTSMDHYYENGPLPDWIGWYAQQLPHWFHAGAALYTLIAELGLVWLGLLQRRLRIICFFIVTPFQISIILTANLAFLNYLVLSLGFLLLDDRFLRRVFGAVRRAAPVLALEQCALSPEAVPAGRETWWRRLHSSLVTGHLSLALSAFCLTWIFYDTAVLLLLIPFRSLPAPLPVQPIVALEPFRIANQYGLFAVMTVARNEIEFQGTEDGETWKPYPFRYQPQDPRQPPRLYAPYQPRFDWNLWFASLGSWREYSWVVNTEARLLQGSPSVLSLFAGNPFPGAPPRQVRAVFWQYWFTDLATKRKEGLWWRREFRGLYAPVLERQPEGRIVVVEMPGAIVP